MNPRLPLRASQFGDAQDNDWRCCWSSSPGQCITKLGCECDHFDRIRNAFLSRSFACSDHGLLVRKTLQIWLRLHLAAQCYQHVFHVQRFGANSIA